jgi:hypothetical protein
VEVSSGLMIDVSAIVLIFTVNLLEVAREKLSERSVAILLLSGFDGEEIFKPNGLVMLGALGD